jgi:dethiobiotin synthetase
MALKIFITGTDTDAGKTYISTGILNVFNKHNYSTLGVKPIASGCELHNGVLHNADALALQQASSIKLPYQKINPYAFEPAIAPHIAAQQIHCDISVDKLIKRTEEALHYPADLCLVEGAGGWYVPLNDKETMADYVKATDLKVILVVGIRLGCINHAILTHKAIENDDIPIAGWIANCIIPQRVEHNEIILALKKWLTSPCLGVVQHRQKVDEVIFISNVL